MYSDSQKFHRITDRPSRVAALFISLLIPLLGVSCSRHDSRELEIVHRQIRSVLELPAYEHVYHEVIYLGQESSFLGIRTRDKRVLFAVDMRVEAGLDLSEDIRLEPGRSNAVTVLLPAARILRIDADEESIEQYFILERGGAITQTEFYREIEASKQAIRDDAIERGILQKAGENARDVIRSMLSGIGYTRVTFRDPEAAR